MSYLITLPHKSFVHTGLFLTFLPFTSILPLMKRNSLELISYKLGIRTKSTKTPSFAALYSPTCRLRTRSQAPFLCYSLFFFFFLYSYFILYLLIFPPHEVPPFLIPFQMLRRSCQVLQHIHIFPFSVQKGMYARWAKERGAARKNWGGGLAMLPAACKVLQGNGVWK